jgi:hypothetical protein
MIPIHLLNYLKMINNAPQVMWMASPLQLPGLSQDLFIDHRRRTYGQATHIPKGLG